MHYSGGREELVNDMLCTERKGLCFPFAIFKSPVSLACQPRAVALDRDATDRSVASTDVFFERWKRQTPSDSGARWLYFSTVSTVISIDYRIILKWNH